MKTLHKCYLVASLFLCLFLIPTANATIMVGNFGSSGDILFEYQFDTAFSGDIIIGVSNEGDSGVASTLALSNFSGLLSGNADQVLSSNFGDDTSSFVNANGEFGTIGQLLTVNVSNANVGDDFGFVWNFSTTDYVPYNDFAFIAFGEEYSVLAQIPAPATVTMMLLALGLLRVTRR